jgi:hypothetical protein
VGLLLRAKGNIESMKNFETPRSEEMALSTGNHNHSMPERLFKDLVVLMKNNDGIKILTNIQIAALHLACMFKGISNTDNRLVNSFLTLQKHSSHYQMSTDRSKFTCRARKLVLAFFFLIFFFF